jgi:hypothetical protein
MKEMLKRSRNVTMFAVVVVRPLEHVRIADLDAGGIEVRSGFAVEDRAHPLGRHPGAVRPIGGQGVDDVGDRKDAGSCRERVAGETAAIAFAIDPLVMVR